jgi:cobalt-zinc-cadmium efflux system protein
MNENQLRDHAHDHAHSSATRLGLASAVNIAFAVVQVAVGLAIGSVVVLADSAHQAVDALGLVTALIALRMARRPADEQWTYGLGKSDALGGFVSALLLVASVVWIVWESVGRLFSPEEVDGWGVIVIGAIAIVVNGGSVLLVGHSHGDENGEGAISLRAARLHLLTDLAGSVIVVVSGVLLTAGGPAWIDPAASLVLSVTVLWSTWRLIVSASQLLLDRVPGRVSTGDVVDTLREQAGVGDVHHVHLRPIGGGRISVTAHVVVDGERSVHDAQSTVERLSSVLERRHLIGHSTLQLECHDCDDDVHAH